MESLTALQAFVEAYAEQKQGLALIIRDDRPHIDVLRAGVRLNFKFSIEDFAGAPRLIARPAPYAVHPP